MLKDTKTQWLMFQPRLKVGLGGIGFKVQNLLVSGFPDIREVLVIYTRKKLTICGVWLRLVPDLEK